MRRQIVYSTFSSDTMQNTVNESRGGGEHDCGALLVLLIPAHGTEMLWVFGSRFACGKSTAYYNSSKVDEILHT